MTPVIRITNTTQAILQAQAKELEGKFGEAMLHINAACYWARLEMPEWRYQAIRVQAERFRNHHFPRKD